MSLQDDFYDLDAHLKGGMKRKFRRIWRAFCDAEAEVETSRAAVRLINLQRDLLQDKPPLSLRDLHKKR